MREFDPKTNIHKRGRLGSVRAVPLSEIQEWGLKIIRPPFFTFDAHPNYMAEITPEKFDALWRESIGTKMTATHYCNQVGEDETPTLRLIRLHWTRARVRDWTPDRVRRICALWKMTPAELCELVQWEHGPMRAFLKNSRHFPPPGPVCVWFYFLENVKFGISVFPPMIPQQQAAS